MGKLKAEKFGAAESKEDMFNGDGVTFKCKLFGSTTVSSPRGNVVCAEAISKLKLKALQMKKEAKEHKQRIFLNISVKGIRIIDDKSKKLEHAHLIHRISFICQDATDKRCFGYIVSLKEGYTLFAFRTEKAAELITNNLKELFDVVFKIYTRQKAAAGGSVNTSAVLKDQNAVEEGQEVQEDTYAIPSLQHVTQPTEGSDPHYKVPSGAADRDQGYQEHHTTTDDTGNLLDWSELNDNIAFMQTNMKHSDSSDLLADLTNVNFDDFSPFSPTSGDEFFSPDPESTGPSKGQDPFAANPFSPAAGEGANKKAILAASHSDSNLVSHSANPFADDQFSPGADAEITKSKSMNAVDSSASSNNNDNRNPFDTAPKQSSSAHPSGDLHELNFAFGAVNQQPSAANQMASMNLNDQSQPTANIFDSLMEPSGDVLAPTLPSNSSPSGAPMADSRDPFASLNSNIDNIRVNLPSSGSTTSGFNSKAKSSDPVTLNALAAASGTQSPTHRPVMPVMQSQPLPYQQPRQYGANPMMPNQPYRHPSANNPFMNMGQMNQPMGMPAGMGGLPPSMNQQQQQPYFGNQTSNSATAAPIYATVDKSSNSDPLAQFGVLQNSTPSAANSGQKQNDLVGFALLQ